MLLAAQGKTNTARHEMKSSMFVFGSPLYVIIYLALNDLCCDNRPGHKLSHLCASVLLRFYFQPEGELDKNQAGRSQSE